MSNLRNTIIPWFKKYLKPTEAQFRTFFNSIWFKDEEIPVSHIQGINDLLLQKADAETLQVHINNKDVHLSAEQAEQLATLPVLSVGNNSDIDSDILNGLYPIEHNPIGSRHFDTSSENKSEWVRISETSWMALPYAAISHTHKDIAFSQLKFTQSFSTSDNYQDYTQNGRNIAITNGVNNIVVTINSADGFIATYQKIGNGNITFQVASGLTLVQVDDTNVIDGKRGSTATVSIVGTEVFLRISNVE